MGHSVTFGVPALILGVLHLHVVGVHVHNPVNTVQQDYDETRAENECKKKCEVWVRECILCHLLGSPASACSAARKLAIASLTCGATSA